MCAKHHDFYSVRETTEGARGRRTKATYRDREKMANWSKDSKFPIAISVVVDVNAK